MLVLHAAFDTRSLLIWGECPPTATGPSKPGNLPYDAGWRKLGEVLERGKRDFSTMLAWLPSAGGVPFPSSGLIADPPAPASKAAISAWHVTALPLIGTAAIDFLCSCHGKEMLAPGVVIGPDLSYWVRAMRFAGSLVARQQFLPDITEDTRTYRAGWKPVILGPDREHLRALAEAMPPVARALSPLESPAPDQPAAHLLESFNTWVVDAMLRSASRPSRPEIPNETPTIHDRWIAALHSPDGALDGDSAELRQLAEQVRTWSQPLASALDAPFRLCFRLEEPTPDADRANWRVQYLLQGSRDPSLLVPAGTVWKQNGRTPRVLKQPGFEAREHLLLSLGQASAMCPEIERSLEQTGAPEAYETDSTGAHLFLTERAIALESAGFPVLLPAWWTRKGTKLRLTASAHVKTPFKSESGLSLNQILDVQWRLALGGESISLAELRELAALKSPLVQFRGQWVQMNAQEIQAALDFWKKKPSGAATVRDVIGMALGKAPGAVPLEFSGVTATGWVGNLVEQLSGSAPFEELTPPPGLDAILRPYQVRGYSWLAFLKRWGLGACLADDMGLGKTIQTLSLIQLARQAGETRPVLLVCPTSVIGNWQKEVARFTPGLTVMVHHGATRVKDASFVNSAQEHALVISSYALLYRDLALLQRIGWSGLVLDEAQNIKNSAAKQAAAARAVSADYRIALTGTPVENHVGDLWSIMEFLNPGFLGTQSSFRQDFFLPIQSTRDPEAAARLKRLTGPFILRRLKTDRSIISDLPGKMEMKVYCSLTREQASLYAALVKESLRAINDATGMQRKGVVLATLSKLKQICNHPAQFLGDNSAIPGRSGKLARLTEMLEEVIAAGDRALVFSQFSEMGEIIRKHLQETFGRETLFLHGGVSKPRRDGMVERFQSESGPPVFVLSLKAGGTGLNLTQASHVFHFDRWWNPAVENQATDRAFRIGQKKRVQVHKFLCAGTFEEKIDEMIERKKEVADNVVGAGESWLTELSTGELRDLFALRKEAVSE